MNKLGIIILMISNVVCAQFSGGDGSSGDPYQITTFDDLDTLREDSGIAEAANYYILTNDISMSTASDDWYIPTFGGYFNGKGYAIRDWEDTDHNTMNFFYQINSNRWIKNLRFVNIDLRKTSSTGAVIPGLFAQPGTNVVLDSIIVDSSNFYNRGTVSGSSTFPESGLICQRITAVGVEITRCVIKNSTVEFYRDIASGSAHNALFVGRVLNGGVKLTKCYVENVTFVTGETLTSHGNAAFFIGFVDAATNDSVVIRDSYILNSTAQSRATSGSRITSAFVSGSGTDEDITIEDCYASFDTVAGCQGAFVSTFDVDDASPNGMFSSYYDSSKIFYGQRAGTHTATTPTPKTTAEMKIQDTYVGFDFSTVWYHNPSINDSYPYLRWANPPDPIYIISPTTGTYLENYSVQRIRIRTDVDSDSVELFYNMAVPYTNDSLETSTPSGYYWSDLRMPADSITWLLNDTTKTPIPSTPYSINIIARSTADTTIGDTVQVWIYGSSITANLTVDTAYANTAGDTLTIIGSGHGVDTVNFWYAIEDTTTWTFIDYTAKDFEYFTDTVTAVLPAYNVGETLYVKLTERITTRNDTTATLLGEQQLITDIKSCMQWSGKFVQTSPPTDTIRGTIGSTTSKIYTNSNQDITCGWVAGYTTGKYQTGQYIYDPNGWTKIITTAAGQRTYKYTAETPTDSVRGSITFNYASSTGTLNRNLKPTGSGGFNLAWDDSWTGFLGYDSLANSILVDAISGFARYYQPLYRNTIGVTEDSTLCGPWKVFISGDYLMGKWIFPNTAEYNQIFTLFNFNGLTAQYVIEDSYFIGSLNDVDYTIGIFKFPPRNSFAVALRLPDYPMSDYGGTDSSVYSFALIGGPGGTNRVITRNYFRGIHPKITR